MTKTYTIRGRNDGFGAQYQAIMSGIVYCIYKKYKYIHTPIVFLDHKQNIDLLNNFIGIPYSKTISNSIDIIKKHEEKVQGCPIPSLFYTNEAVALLKKYYYSTPKPKLKNIEIAIHIRRGDVTEDIPERFTSDIYYNKIIRYLNNKYPKLKITIVSQGDIDNFKEIVGKNLEFKLNETIEIAFHTLVSAKILVTSKSSFSYTAAILNSNKVYYLNFWHKPLNHWKIISYLQ